MSSGDRGQFPQVRSPVGKQTLLNFTLALKNAEQVSGTNLRQVGRNHRTEGVR
jgi:hypothetical protein